MGAETHVALSLRQLFGKDGLDGLGHLGVQAAAGVFLTPLLVQFLHNMFEVDIKGQNHCCLTNTRQVTILHFRKKKKGEF